MINKCYFGDCRDTIKTLIEDGVKVQTCVTSPPYFGLRDYGNSDQLGLESTPEEYISNMVDVFRLVKDLLTDDGTLWINIGDSYAANRGYQVNQTKGGTKHGQAQAVNGRSQNTKEYGLKPKDLIGIPWMLAFALRADGWYLRQDIIWHKPNAMPESVKDRCTKAHEYIFLLSKSQKYYFDNKSIEEPAKWERRGKQTEKKSHQGTAKHLGGKSLEELPIRDKKNKRSVWSVSTSGYRGSHCAVYPPALIEPCILSGSRIGDIVFDPFMGSGTTAQVATQLGRNWIGCELNTEYEVLQHERLEKIPVDITKFLE